MSDVADVLERAGRLIEPEGAWIQRLDRAYVSGRYRYCAVGAIEEVCGDWDKGWVARSILRRVIGRESITVWNDESGRTQAEVVAKLREAAKLARENADA
jgi:hypothetical protein